MKKLLFILIFSLFFSFSLSDDFSRSVLAPSSSFDINYPVGNSISCALSSCVLNYVVKESSVTCPNFSLTTNTGVLLISGSFSGLTGTLNYNLDKDTLYHIFAWNGSLGSFSSCTNRYVGYNDFIQSPISNYFSVFNGVTQQTYPTVGHPTLTRYFNFQKYYYSGILGSTTINNYYSTGFNSVFWSGVEVPASGKNIYLNGLLTDFDSTSTGLFYSFPAISGSITITGVDYTGISVDLGGSPEWFTGTELLIRGGDGNFDLNGNTINYLGNSGVTTTIHYTIGSDNHVYADQYTLKHIYLNGLYEKAYTGGAENYWVMLQTQNNWTGFHNYTGGFALTPFVTVTGNNSQIYSGNLFEGFYNQGMQFIVANYPIVLIACFGLLLVLGSYRVLFPKKHF